MIARHLQLILYFFTLSCYQSFWFPPFPFKVPSKKPSIVEKKPMLEPPHPRPIKRDFVEIKQSPFHNVLDQFRVLQFNILADGLSGLRDDLGAFSRADNSFLTWSYRKTRLLHEIVQYNPDIITLQECDHFYDFFSPELQNYGYAGFFAPKPASACKEVSDHDDGCALFYKTEKFQVIDCVTLPYTVPGEGEGVWKKQNQVALLVSLLSATKSQGQGEGPALLVGTTHLKASKTEEGEQLRLHEAQQLLEAMRSSMKKLSSLHGMWHGLYASWAHVPGACIMLSVICDVLHSYSSPSFILPHHF
ncbi:hypothetical protein EON64_19780 [archaeon]|nr:MAG: hypothetical protein EON64_19780 [archaeon]